MEDNLTRFLIKDKKLLIDIDIVKKELYIDYCYEDGIGFKKAILKQIDYETAQEINEYFKIDLEEYGVVVNNSDESKMDVSQEKYLKKDDFEIRVFIILTVFSLISALYFGVEYMDTEMKQRMIFYIKLKSYISECRFGTQYLGVLKQFVFYHFQIVSVIVIV